MNPTHPVQLRIPRDGNFLLPAMILENVTGDNQSLHLKMLDIEQLQPNPNQTISIHFEIQPLNTNLSYLFIYQFDDRTPWVESTDQLDGWTTLCASSKFSRLTIRHEILIRSILTDPTTDSLHRHYIDNRVTSMHRSVVFGLRELASSEVKKFCPIPSRRQSLRVINELSTFTSNYQLRIYTSGCYYLDQHGNWQSDGLLVSSIFQ